MYYVIQFITLKIDKAIIIPLPTVLIPCVKQRKSIHNEK